MTPTLRLSVVIPVKDDADNLARCLQALAPQRGHIFEVIVVDNGSRDDSASVAEANGATVIRERHPGIAAAASAGYDAASGDLIGRLDADSLPHDDWAANAIAFFETHPDTAALTGGATFTDGARALRKLGAAVYLGAYYLVVSSALGHVPLFGSNFVMRCEAWRAISGEVHRHDLLIHDDMDVSFHLGPRARIRFAPRVRVGISSRPFSDGRGGLRVRRGFHTIVLHWPHDLPWLRVWRRAGGRAPGRAPGPFRSPEGLTAPIGASTLAQMTNKETVASDQYPDGNERDIASKQRTSVSDSAAVKDDDIDADKVKVLPGTGGPDDVGDIEVEPDDYNRSGH